MILKIYQKNIIYSFLKNIFIVSIVFMCLAFFLNILEEIRFFKNTDASLQYPIFLTFLNVPTILYELFPFVILISTQLFFLNSFNKTEIIIYKNFGLSNIKVIKIITLFSFIFGIFIITVFYTFSSELKYSYLSFKNKFTDDNKYLAVINENGLWIKDEINQTTNIINAEKFKDNLVENITIVQLNKDFDFIKNINAKGANIEKNNWLLYGVEIFYKDKPNENYEKYEFYSNFNKQKIDSLFSNLSSQNLYKLKVMMNDYKNLGYSTLEIKAYIYKIISYPFYLAIMALIGSILMYSVKSNRSKTIVILIGVIVSVFIYYLIYFSNLLGINENLPLIASTGLPYILLFLASSVGLVSVNEK